jgi:microsomal prostaglandin-E synthase 1
MSVLSVHSVLFVIFGTTAILLSLKALFLGAATAAARGKLKSFLNAEDAAWLGGVHKNPDPEVVARWGRAHRNDLENLLPFFICGLLYVLSEGPAIAGYVYCGAFLIGRVLHTGAYLGARPMLRRNAYTLGFLTIAIMGVHAAWLMAQRLLS